MENLKEQLNKYGDILVLKDSTIFTLLLKTANRSLANAETTLKILESVLDYLGDTKTKIEAMRNDEDYLLLILK